MKIIKIFGDCGRNPIRLACFPSGNLANMGVIVIGNDESIGELPSYDLHVRCAKTNVDRILEVIGDHGFTDTQGGRIPLAEDGESLCVHSEGCPLSRLTIQELLDPLVIDELTPNQSFVDPHGYN